MKVELKDVLYEGEKVLWEGKAEPFHLFDGPYKKSILLTWCISAIVVIAFLAFYIPFHIRSGGRAAQFVICFVLVCMIPFVFSLQPLTTKYALDKKVTYLFTNARAICINDTQVNAFSISADTPCRIESLPNGSDVIYMGEGGCRIKPTKNRNAAVLRIKSADSEDLTGMVFYGVKDAAAICKKFTPFSSVVKG